MNTIDVLVKKRGNVRVKIIKKIMGRIIHFYGGLDIGVDTIVGDNVVFKHGGLGTVIHNNTVLEDGVMIMSNVTIGRSDVWKPIAQSKFEKIIIKKCAVICTGAKILCKEGTLIVGENSIIGANAVLTCSTGDNEIWAGIPARMIKLRDD